MSRLVIGRAHTDIKITNNTLLHPFKTITTSFLLIESPTSIKMSLFSSHMPRVTFST